jgi:hypothetical protein
MISVTVPFGHVLKLIYTPGPYIKLNDDVDRWLKNHGHKPKWIMNNPWEAIFEYKDADQAMLFKLTWG